MNLKSELYRKALHLLLILIPLSYCLLGKWLFLIIVTPICATVVALDYYRGKNAKIKEIFAKIFTPILREHEIDGNKLCGASWVALATCITFFVFKKEIAVTAFGILVISDAAAALIGKAYPSRPFFEKSFNGAMAFFVTGLIVLISCGVIFHSRAWFYIFGLFALFCVTIIESRPSLLKIDDNFTIPIMFSCIMGFFDVIWNYSF